jgi:hypothetical protein
MFKTTVITQDGDGKDVEDTLYFHMFIEDLIKLDKTFPDGFESFWKEYESLFGFSNGVDIRDETFVEPTEEQKNKMATQILKMFTTLIELGYGTVDKTTNRFSKDKKSYKKFRKGAVYDEVLFKLMSDTEFSIAFITGVVPQKRTDKIAALKPASDAVVRS